MLIYYFMKYEGIKKIQLVPIGHNFEQQDAVEREGCEQQVAEERERCEERLSRQGVREHSLLRVLCMQVVWACVLMCVCFGLRAVPLELAQQGADKIRIAFEYDMFKEDKQQAQAVLVDKTYSAIKKYEAQKIMAFDMPLSDAELQESAQGVIILSKSLSVLACGDGQVDSIEYLEDAQVCITIWHKEGLYSYYQGSLASNLQVGEQVQKGQHIAFKTQDSTLLFDVRLDGQSVLESLLACV